MDLYTLDSEFLAQQSVDDFVSAIWTERYTTAGDTQLVLPATAKNMVMLSEGTYLGLRGSREVCQIETQEIEEGLLKVTGPMLDRAILEQRWIWEANPEYDITIDEEGEEPDPPTARVADITSKTRKPGELISYLVDRFAANPMGYSPFPSPYTLASLDWANEGIDDLSLGSIDTTGAVVQITVPLGPLYQAIERVAQEHGVGMSLYLESADPIDGYLLKFRTYRGLDRTSDQEFRPVVRLSPNEESISKIKEVRSRALYKNVCYVYYNGVISKHLAEPSLPEPIGLERRVLITDAEGEPPGRKVAGSTTTTPGTYTMYGYRPGISTYTPPHTIVDPVDLANFRAQNARDALANHNYIRAVDGETSPISDYIFGVDYGLGDLIELEGLTGTIAKARITEYIRSQDQSGERSYPTISVVNPEGG